MKKFLLVLALVLALVPALAAAQQVTPQAATPQAAAQQVTPQPECISGAATSTSVDAAQSWITRIETGGFSDWFVWRTGDSCFAFSPKPVTAFHGDEVGETQFRDNDLHYSCQWANGVQFDVDGHGAEQFGSFPFVRYISHDVYTVCD